MRIGKREKMQAQEALRSKIMAEITRKNDNSFQVVFSGRKINN